MKTLYAIRKSKIRDTVHEIMIVPDEFFAGIQPLVTHRRAQGLRVEVVRVKDVYALFNDGIVHPEAIRRFLAYTYERWKKPGEKLIHGSLKKRMKKSGNS